MDDRRFETVARALAAGGSRRQVLKAMLGLGAVVGGAAVSGVDADAKRPEEPPCASWRCEAKKRCRARNERCSRNDQCCSNRCTLRIADPKIYACD